MKRYIKSSVENCPTLKEWVNNFDEDIYSRIFITSDSQLFNFDTDYVFVKLNTYLNFPDQYFSHIRDYSDWLVTGVEHTPDKDYYCLYIEQPN